MPDLPPQATLLHARLLHNRHLRPRRRHRPRRRRNHRPLQPEYLPLLPPPHLPPQEEVLCRRGRCPSPSRGMEGSPEHDL